MKRVLLLGALSFSLVGCGAPPAQAPSPIATLTPPAPPPAVVDELDRPLPLDARVTRGQLANGLTYYVLPHKKPENRAQVWLAVNAGSVLEDDDQRGLAPTTIATMLRKMEDKGVLTHRPEGRQFVYRPAVSEDQVRRSMVGELVARLFEGDPRALVAHLVSEHEIDPAELRELRRRVGETPRRRGRA